MATKPGFAVGWRALGGMALLAGLLFFMGAGAALAESRLALVIGNAAYGDRPLVNTLNDARDMAAKLQGLGFQVDRAHTDLGRRELARTINEFVRAARRAAALAWCQPPIWRPRPSRSRAPSL